MLAGLLGSHQIHLRQAQVRPMGIINLLLFLLPFALVLGCGVLEPLHYPVLPFALTQVVVVLSPSWQVVGV